MDSHRIPPNLLFVSFLIVSGAYVLSMTLLLVNYYSVAAAFFPETAKHIQTKQSAEMLLADPELVFPSAMFWIVLAVQAISCFVIGWLVTRLAPLAKFNHAIFVAVILLVTFMQMAIGAPSEMQWKFMLLMAACPICTLLGAQWHGQSPLEKNEGREES